MTDQELKDLIASNAIAIAEWRESLEASHQTFAREWRESLEASHQTFAREWRESLEASQRASAREMNELRESQKETGRQIKEMNDKLGKQIGALGNKFGSFTEGMAFPSLDHVLRQRFHMEAVNSRSQKSRNGRTLEIDVLAYGDKEGPEAYLVEIKSRLEEESVKQLLKTIAEFPVFYPEHAHRRVYGIVAGVEIIKGAQTEAFQHGIYLAGINEDIFKLRIPRGFQPRVFGPFTKGATNGSHRNGKKDKQAKKKR